jgi:hypothetical protein
MPGARNCQVGQRRIPRGVALPSAELSFDRLGSGPPASGKFIEQAGLELDFSRAHSLV